MFRSTRLSTIQYPVCQGSSRSAQRTRISDISNTHRHSDCIDSIAHKCVDIILSEPGLPTCAVRIKFDLTFHAHDTHQCFRNFASAEAGSDLTSALGWGQSIDLVRQEDAYNSEPMHSVHGEHCSPPIWAHSAQECQ